MGEKNKYPRILVISNNPFSEVKNNGKTLLSFFRDFPKESIAQLYFSNELSDSKLFDNFFRITDGEILKKFIKKEKKCGIKINSESKLIENNKEIENKSFINEFKQLNISRIFREIIWSENNWKTKDLDIWLDEFNPDFIFFCAGDSGFAYNIVQYVKKRYSTKLITYITDDYILPRRTLSVFWWIRRNYILNKMKLTIEKSDIFLTISDAMREKYKEIFNKDSKLAINIPNSLKDTSIKKVENDKIIMVYAGGLHFKRYKTLNLLANAIKKYNESSNKREIELRIYSTQNLNSKTLKLLNIDGASKFCGGLNQNELKVVLNYADILVHVESFNRKCIESTRLSVSTKIPEYLSLEKPILAIGPEEIASMKVMKNHGFKVYSEKDLKKSTNFIFQEIFSSKHISKFKSILENVDIKKIFMEGNVENL